MHMYQQVDLRAAGVKRALKLSSILSRHSANRKNRKPTTQSGWCFVLVILFETEELLHAP